MEVGPHAVETRGEAHAVATTICVDLDYADIARSARRAGGVLAAPSNDWFGGFEELHHRTAVWAAVIGDVAVVRATGHGVSSVYDGTGRVLARETSQSGDVVLVVDAPVRS